MRRRRQKFFSGKHDSFHNNRQAAGGVQSRPRPVNGQGSGNEEQSIICPDQLTGDIAAGLAGVGSAQRIGQSTFAVEPEVSEQNPIVAAHDRVLQQREMRLQGEAAKDAGSVPPLLDEAQYKLVKDLETSLHNLRQEIEESKEVIQKITSLLEERDRLGGSDSNGETYFGQGLK